MAAGEGFARVAVLDNASGAIDRVVYQILPILGADFDWDWFPR